MLVLRQRAASALARAQWDLPVPPMVWSPRMTRCAGLFVIEKDTRGAEHHEIRLSTPLIRCPGRPWPIEVCGCNCRDAESVLTRIIEHELVHYKLWKDGEADWGHTRLFRRLALEAFGHQGIRHGIGVEE